LLVAARAVGVLAVEVVPVVLEHLREHLVEVVLLRQH
jgi:hypothetical protein